MTANEQGKSILLVDDNVMSGKIMELSFTKFGYSCRTARSGKDALSLLETFTPDIILSDYEMPVMNGFEFRTQLLNHAEWKNIPFVFLTAHSSGYLMLEGLNLNAIDYIVKDTPFPIIVSKLNNILSSLQHEHEKSIDELKAAADRLQVTSVPKTEPAVPGYNIHFWNKTFENYPGGDFIDYIRADERYTFIFIGDIMGKKWQAWFFSFGYLSYIRSAIRFCILDKRLRCLEIIQKVNIAICQDEGMKNILSSLSLLMLDRETGNVTYTGAGDLPLIHYSAKSSAMQLVSSSGLLLGLQEDGMFDEQTIHLEPGDRLLAYTDGLTDLMDDGHKKSDFASFAQRITNTLQETISFEAIKQQLLGYFTGSRQVDDASVLFIERQTD